MKNKMILIFCFLFIALLTFAQGNALPGNTNSQNISVDERVQNLENKISDINSRITLLEKDIENQKGDQTSFQVTISKNPKLPSPTPTIATTPNITSTPTISPTPVSSLPSTPSLQESLSNIAQSITSLETRLGELSSKLQALIQVQSPVTSTPTPSNILPSHSPTTSSTPTQSPVPNNTNTVLPSSPSTEEAHLKTIADEIHNLSNSIQTLHTDLDGIKGVLSPNNQSQKQMIDTISNSLNTEIKNGSVSLNPINNDSVKIRVSDTILFGKGEISLSPKGQMTIEKLAPYLNSLKDKDIFIIGHADKSPITGSILKRFYPTNWELSVARAVMVVRFLTEELHVSPENITAAGRSFYSPTNTNDSTKTTMQDDRRTEIWIFPHMKEGKALVIKPAQGNQSQPATNNNSNQINGISNELVSKNQPSVSTTNASMRTQTNRSHPKIQAVKASDEKKARFYNADLSQSIANTVPKL